MGVGVKVGFAVSVLVGATEDVAVSVCVGKLPIGVADSIGAVADCCGVAHPAKIASTTLTNAKP